jgi:tetratricopeptide (TPR) repeat protein
VLLLVAYMVYANMGGEPPTAGSGGGAPGIQGQMPIEQHVHTIDLAPLEEAVRKRPDDLDALLLLANGLHDSGAWPRAIEAYGRYLERNPGNPDARVDMGICLFELSRVDTARSQSLARRAVEEMERAAKEHPAHQQAAFNLGIVLLNTGDIAGSNRWFARAVEIDSQNELGRHAQSILSQHRTLTP